MALKNKGWRIAALALALFAVFAALFPGSPFALQSGAPRISITADSDFPSDI
ncbi:MAG: hypothetical protein AAF607_11470 [Pseudomonadota bacterium]